MTSPKTKFIHIRVDEKTHDQITEACKPDSVSEVLRKMIQLFITLKAKQ